MNAYRYETVTHEGIGRINRLIARGWCPVRETGMGPSALVLLEREVGAGSSTALAVQLAEIPLLEDFTAEERQALADVCEVYEFREGDAIYRESDGSPALHMLLEGKVQITIPGLPTEDMQITDLGPHDVFGEVAFFEPGQHTGTAECLSPVRVVRLDRQGFETLLQSNPLAAHKLGHGAAQLLAARLRDTDAWVWELLRDRQNARIIDSWRRFRERTVYRRPWQMG